MVTTGSKYFYSLAVVGFLSAIAYGIITNGTAHGGVITLLTGPGAVGALLGPLTLGYKGSVGDHLGFAVLIGFSVSTFGLGIATSAFRDADPEALAQLDGTATVPPVVSNIGPGYWPLAMGFGAAMVMVGLATSSVIFVAGLIVIALSGLEWTIQAWAESQTADATLNAEIRRRLMSPIEVPLAAVGIIGVFIFSVSRIFLSASKLDAVWWALGFGVVIVVTALVISARPTVRRSLVAGAVVVIALAVLAVGIIGAVVGPREFERHGYEPAAKQQSAAPAIGSGSDSARSTVVGETA